MVIYALDNAPQRLRGILSRYCLELRAGLFVGRIDARMRDLLWEKVEQLATRRTQAVLVWREPTEQGFAFRTFGSNRRTPVRVDGIWLIQTSASATAATAMNDYEGVPME
jgi:CRISPR-associated protein Cas2